MKLTQRVLNFVKQNNLIKPGDRVIVAVSGGADSIALAHVLVTVRAQLGIQLRLAHYNHRLRKTADADQRFVERFANQYQLPLTVEGRPRTHGHTMLSEDEARCLRVDFLLRVARQWKAQAVALAHTENDLAETVLMRLIRGAGLHGLRGILAMRDMQGISFVRPLIHVKRTDIEAYLRSQKLRFCTDSTNLKAVYFRNKVRLKLLPLLAKEYNPAIAHILTDIAAVAQEDYDFLSLEAQKRFKENVVRSKGTVKIALTKINQQHPSMRRLLIRRMVEALIDDSTALNFAHMRVVEDLLAVRPTGAALSLPHGLQAVKTNKYLIMSL